MDRASLLLLVSLSCLTLFVQQDLQTPSFVLSPSVRMVGDLSFVDAGSDPALRLDLFIPKEGTGPFPAVLFVSCTGWVRGDKSQMWRQSAYLAERGYISATTQCRPAPATRFPAQIDDAVSAVRWLRRHANEYHLDPDRVAIAGASSGGYLAAMVGMNRWTGAEWSAAPDAARVQATVVFNAVLDAVDYATGDVSDRTRVGNARINLTTFLGRAFEIDPALWRVASALTHVTPQAAPMLLVHGTSDATVPFSQSVEMQRRLRTVGVRAELFAAEGADHGFFYNSPWYDPTLRRVTEFLDSVLK